jgi:hypothetical protein
MNQISLLVPLLAIVVAKFFKNILDIGGGNTSTFYNMEKQAVYGKKGK